MLPSAENESAVMPCAVAITITKTALLMPGTSQVRDLLVADEVRGRARATPSEHGCHLRIEQHCMTWQRQKGPLVAVLDMAVLKCHFLHCAFHCCWPAVLSLSF